PTRAASRSRRGAVAATNRRSDRSGRANVGTRGSSTITWRRQRRGQFRWSRPFALRGWLAAGYERRCRPRLLHSDREHVDWHLSQERRHIGGWLQLRYADESG